MRKIPSSVLNSLVDSAKEIKTKLNKTVRRNCREHLKELAMLNSAPWQRRDLMDRMRADRLTQTIDHARRHSPYYAHLMRGLATDSSSIFQEVPVTSKSDIIESGLSRSSPAKSADERAQGRTSGSTGQPFVFEIDKLIPRRHQAQQAYVYLKAGAAQGSRTVALRYGTAILSREWYFPTFHVLGLGTEVDPKLQLSSIEAARPALLHGNPSHIVRIAEELTSSGDTLPIPKICCTSEILSSQDKALIECAFECRVFELYGSAEASNIAFYLPDETEWTILEPRVWVEILDEHSYPVAAGQVGEIVVTTLTERIAPLIRYGTGDLATLAVGDGSGSSGMRLAAIEGRMDDCVLLDSERRKRAIRIHTQHFWNQDDVADQVKRWQIHQYQDRSIRVRLELHHRKRPEELDQRIIEFVRSTLGPLRVLVETVEQVHDANQGKFRAITCDIDTRASGGTFS